MMTEHEIDFWINSTDIQDELPFPYPDITENVEERRVMRVANALFQKRKFGKLKYPGGTALDNLFCEWRADQGRCTIEKIWGGRSFYEFLKRKMVTVTPGQL